MRKYYPGITVFKLAGSLLVLIAHIMLLRYLEFVPGQKLFQFTALATRVVVPCFYVIAGFLAYKGWTHAASPRKYIGRYFKRILIIYCFFCCIFVAEHIVPKLISEGLSAGNLFVQAKILFMAFFLNGPFIQFWFIPPLIFGLLSAYWLLQKGQARLTAIMAIIGFAGIQFVSGSLMTLPGITKLSFPFLSPVYLEYLSLFATRYIGFGFTFVIAGVLLAKHEEQWMQINIKPILIFSIALTMVETMLLLALSEWTRDYKLTFSVLPNTVLIFYGIIRMKGAAVQKYHKQISLFSIVTFFGHVLFMYINYVLLGWDSASMTVTQDVVLLLVTFLECVAATALLSLVAKYLQAKQTRSISM
ncbi:hypothetical protein BK133_29250 [Paenibacillus sp. FSL H8-0548]|uniref:acyltransferase family protein n=1 Tax=Paenibacillus sp. FSL H8-0548 TaxID=1920422 RepID=UPI00096E9818|nr:acyltransferase family protein [Paenibacillus sp. FSL H8-0548]OMF20420.1 hypothetical protein BK133_29250 [Paenibacillus sp. FSL H8-0548]